MVLVTVAYVFYAFCLLFAACELCQRATDTLNEIVDVIGQFDWYSFPYEIQRILPTMLIVAQKQTVMECFGSVSCCRESYQKVNAISWNINPWTYFKF